MVGSPGLAYSLPLSIGIFWSFQTVGKLRLGCRIAENFLYQGPVLDINGCITVIDNFVRLHEVDLANRRMGHSHNLPYELLI
jgi:hypothetical protein